MKAQADDLAGQIVKLQNDTKGLGKEYLILCVITLLLPIHLGWLLVLVPNMIVYLENCKFFFYCMTVAGPPRWRRGSGLDFGSEDPGSISRLPSPRVGPLMERR